MSYKKSVNICLHKVLKKDKGLLASLMDDYLSELYHYKDIAVGPTTVSEYKYFDDYWSDDNRYAFFLIQHQKIVGFVLVRSFSKKQKFLYEISEFYILPKYRKRGLGRLAINALFSRYCGHWKLQVYEFNNPALLFWKNCIENTSTIREIKVTKRHRQDAKIHQYSFVVDKHS